MEIKEVNSNVVPQQAVISAPTGFMAVNNKLREEVIALIYKIRETGVSYGELSHLCGDLISRPAIKRLQTREWWPQTYTKQMEIKTLLQSAWEEIIKKEGGHL